VFDRETKAKARTRYGHESHLSEESSISYYSGNEWPEINNTLRKITKNENERSAKKLARSLHHIGVANEVMRYEIDDLRQALPGSKSIQHRLGRYLSRHRRNTQVKLYYGLPGRFGKLDDDERRQTLQHTLRSFVRLIRDSFKSSQSFQRRLKL
jgi:hypothetical protein